MNKNTLPQVTRFPIAKQRRMDELLEKNSEGSITPKEKAKLEQLVSEAEQWMVANAKRLAEMSRRDRRHLPDSAVPVTVWVRPGSARR